MRPSSSTRAGGSRTPSPSWQILPSVPSSATMSVAANDAQTPTSQAGCGPRARSSPCRRKRPWRRATASQFQQDSLTLTLLQKRGLQQHWQADDRLLNVAACFVWCLVLGRGARSSLQHNASQVSSLCMRACASAFAPGDQPAPSSQLCGHCNSSISPARRAAQPLIVSNQSRDECTSCSHTTVPQQKSIAGAAHAHYRVPNTQSAAATTAAT